MRRDGEQVAERGRQERCELLFREQLEERGFELVDAALEGRQELHTVCCGANVMYGVMPICCSWQHR